MRARSSCSTCCSGCCAIIYGADHVTYVRNITDVDDKINARAAEEYPGLPLNEAIRKVTEKTDRQFHDDVAALGCLPPTVEPRATEHIAEMNTLIEKLIASGNAYVAEDNVLFSVPSMKDYGQLSKRPLDEMIAGARVEVAPYKTRRAGFRAVEAVEAGRAGVAVARRHRGARPAGLAHRMLGDVVEISRRDLRHSWRRHRSRLSASRGRDRAIALRLPYAGDGELLDAQRLLAGRRREDDEVARQFRDDPRVAEGLAGREWCSLHMLSTHYRQPINWTATEASKRLQKRSTIGKDA